jgi:Rps23 Pro-64 3,4-dihydroxylase Tpa1-like proline 4-hydroxylase
MNKIYEDAQKRFFVYNNVLEESLIDSILSESNELLKKNEYIVRFAIKNTVTFETIIDVFKPYAQLTDYEKQMFHKSYTDEDNFKLTRRDGEVTLSYELSEKVHKLIGDIVKTEYNINTATADHGSIIYYGPEYFMGRHADGNPNKPRLCTAVLYCNEAKEGEFGGDVLFYENYETDTITYTHKPLRNQLIIFDSLYSLGIDHEVAEIKNWYRYVYRIYFDR